MAPRIAIPDYSHIQQRGAIVGNMVEKLAGIVGTTVGQVTQIYQQNRSLEHAYKGVRRMVLDGQESFGLSDKQADALMSKLKYREGEKIEAYEKRIAGPLSNMLSYEDFSEKSDYKIKMPDPFIEPQNFLAAMNSSYLARKTQETGAVVQDVTTMDKPETREGATEIIAGRMGGRPVSEQELQQYPGYRALPSQADLDKEAAGRVKAQRDAEIYKANLALKKAQTTSAKVKAMAGLKNMQDGVDELKDLDTITRMEIAARKLLKDIPEKDEKTGELSEEHLDMMELSQILREKRNEISKTKIRPKETPDAKSIAMELQQNVREKMEAGYERGFFGLGKPKEPSEKEQAIMFNEMLADEISRYAKQELGVTVDPKNISKVFQTKDKFGRPYSVGDVVDMILKKAGTQQTTQPTVGGRVGR